jgi:hypothetical protein
MVDFGLWPLVVSVVAIVSGCAVAIVATIARKEVRALEIRERIAMIERGLVPPPEVDPRGFDRAMNQYDRRAMRRSHRHAPFRHRRLGIIYMGIGFGLMMLIGIDSLRVGIRVGGFFVVIGLAFFINALFEPVPAPDTGAPPTLLSQPSGGSPHEDSQPSQPPSSLPHG